MQLKGTRGNRPCKASNDEQGRQTIGRSWERQAKCSLVPMFATGWHALRRRLFSRSIKRFVGEIGKQPECPSRTAAQRKAVLFDVYSVLWLEFGNLVHRYGYEQWWPKSGDQETGVGGESAFLLTFPLTMRVTISTT